MGIQDLISLIEDYLVCVPGTPTVERWLGEVAMQEAKHRARKIDIERLESMVRIIKQDLKGRRPVPNEFDPKELLVKPVPGRAHGGTTEMSIFDVESGLVRSRSDIQRGCWLLAV